MFTRYAPCVDLVVTRTPLHVVNPTDTGVQDGRLCATPFGVDVVGITEFIALLGALVGGLSARQRRERGGEAE